MMNAVVVMDHSSKDKVTKQFPCIAGERHLQQMKLTWSTATERRVVVDVVVIGNVVLTIVENVWTIKGNAMKKLGYCWS